LQVSGDEDKHEALICSCCLTILNWAFELRVRSRNAEKFYFGKHRNKLRDRNRERAEEEGDEECPGAEEDYQESTLTIGINDVTMEEEEMETAVNDELGGRFNFVHQTSARRSRDRRHRV
jgi:hypothetical protein